MQCSCKLLNVSFALVYSGEALRRNKKRGFFLWPGTKLIGGNLNFSAAIQDNTDYLLYNSLNRLVHPQFFLASQLMDLVMSCLIVGGGWKVNLLKEELEKRKSEDGMMMFTDSYDVIFAASSESILGDFLDAFVSCLKYL